MQNLKLRPMTEPEYQKWREESRENYAAEKEKSGLSRADAIAEMEKSFARHLPEGRLTKNHHLYSVVGSDDQPVAMVWWGLNSNGSELAPWIFDIVVDPAQRGKGLGRLTMQLAETDVKAKGFRKLGLHVFGHNSVAHGLYKSLGFRETNIVMWKDFA